VAINALIEQGIVDKEFAADVLAVDFTNPVCFQNPCGLFKLTPIMRTEPAGPFQVLFVEHANRALWELLSICRIRREIRLSRKAGPPLRQAVSNEPQIQCRSDWLRCWLNAGSKSLLPRYPGSKGHILKIRRSPLAQPSASGADAGMSGSVAGRIHVRKDCIEPSSGAIASILCRETTDGGTRS
jgi:hypothetical protein